LKDQVMEKDDRKNKLVSEIRECVRKDQEKRGHEVSKRLVEVKQFKTVQSEKEEFDCYNLLEEVENELDSKNINAFSFLSQRA
jgi:hypothetical protein